MTDCYTLIPQRSRFTVQAFAGGILSGFAHSPVFNIRRFGGEVHFAPEADKMSCQIIAEAESLELTGHIKQGDAEQIRHQMFEEVLEIHQYPRITFNSTEFAVTKIADSWYRARIRGQLQLHGLTATHQLDSQLRLVDDEIRLSGEFPLLLSAYRLKRVSALGGMIQVQDELKFVFDLVGKKNSEPLQ